MKANISWAVGGCESQRDIRVRASAIHTCQIHDSSALEAAVAVSLRRILKNHASRYCRLNSIELRRDRIKRQRIAGALRPGRSVYGERE